jgi:hypothetical protein
LANSAQNPPEITDRPVLYNAANEYMSLEAEISFCDPMEISEVGGFVVESSIIHLCLSTLKLHCKSGNMLCVQFDRRAELV